jgi:hypothetical protein
MNLVEEALTEQWGEKCPEYEQGCVVCQAWREYENLVTYGESLTPNLTFVPPDLTFVPPKSLLLAEKAMAENNYTETRHYILLKNLLIAIANDREAVRIMTTKKEMVEAVAAMKHLWE